MGRLERHLDQDLIARMRNGPRRIPKPLFQVKPPRAADTYRAARRYQTLKVERGVWKTDAKVYYSGYEPRRYSKWYPRHGAREAARAAKRMGVAS